nr:MAG TPA: hypothetical protein [Caudoviricetes sp.]
MDAPALELAINAVALKFLVIVTKCSYRNS